MSDKPVEVLTAFLIAVEPNGVVSVINDRIPAMSLQRVATLEDIAMYSSHASRSANNAIIASMVAPKAPPSVADRVNEALAKRNEE